MTNPKQGKKKKKESKGKQKAKGKIIVTYQHISLILVHANELSSTR